MQGDFSNLSFSTECLWYLVITNNLLISLLIQLCVGIQMTSKIYYFRAKFIFEKNSNVSLKMRIFWNTTIINQRSVHVFCVESFQGKSSHISEIQYFSQSEVCWFLRKISTFTKIHHKVKKRYFWDCTIWCWYIHQQSVV